MVELNLRDDRNALISIQAKVDLQGNKAYRRNGKAISLKELRRLLKSKRKQLVGAQEWDDKGALEKVEEIVIFQEQ